MIGSHVSPFKQFFSKYLWKIFCYNYFDKKTQTIEKTFIELHFVRFCQEIIFNSFLVHCLPVKLFKLFKIYILTALVLEKKLDQALYFTHSSIKPYRTSRDCIHHLNCTYWWMPLLPYHNERRLNYKLIFLDHFVQPSCDIQHLLHVPSNLFTYVSTMREQFFGCIDVATVWCLPLSSDTNAHYDVSLPFFFISMGDI